MSSLTPFSRELYSDAYADSLKTQLDEPVVTAPPTWLPDDFQVSSLAEAQAAQQTESLTRLNWLLFGAAAFLVSVPVFIQAPLVRSLPWFSLTITVGWFWLSSVLQSRPTTRVWGDLLLGFTWTWLAGSIYWGWLRWEPLWHLPIEAIGLPFAVVGLRRGWNQIGDWFYIGSLLGTAVTDLYFYLVKLMPFWRQLMLAEPDWVQPIFQAAVLQVKTPWGVGCATILAILLLVVGCLPLRSRQPHWWAFGGAVLSTMLVDGLFWLVASAS